MIIKPENDYRFLREKFDDPPVVVSPQQRGMNLRNNNIRTRQVNRRALNNILGCFSDNESENTTNSSIQGNLSARKIKNSQQYDVPSLYGLQPLKSKQDQEQLQSDSIKSEQIIMLPEELRQLRIEKFRIKKQRPSPRGNLTIHDQGRQDFYLLTSRLNNNIPKDNSFLLKDLEKKELRRLLEKEDQRIQKEKLKNKQETLNKILNILERPIINDECLNDLPAATKIQIIDAPVNEHKKENETIKLEKLRQLRQLNIKVKYSMRQVRLSLRNTLLRLRRLKLTPRDLLRNDVFSVKPYQKKHSYELIQSVKKNDIDHVRELLNRNRFLVYDFDHAFLTPLHWSVKRKFFQMTQMLLQRGADSNSKDLIGRNPLYIAVQYESVELVQLLLYNRAEPWSTIQMDYSTLKMNHLIKFYLTMSRKIHILLRMTPPHLREATWRKESVQLFVEPDGQI